MNVILDEQAVDLAGPSLGALLDAARARLADDSGRVVVEVEVDGQSLKDQQIAERRTEAVADREVRLTSADPRELAVETLEQVQTQLGRAGQQQEQAAELLQEDRAAEAMTLVGEAIVAWLQVQQAVLHSTMLCGIDLDQVEVDGTPAHELTALALQNLQAVKAHLESNDTVALADALAYEWPETTARWQALIDTLIRKIEG